jgi:hypothetical protein
MVSGATGSMWIFNLTIMAKYFVYVKIVDFVSESATSPTATITVTPAPLSVTITATATVISLDQSVTFNCTITSGTPPYYYEWFLNNSLVGTAATYTFNATKGAGISSVYLNVTSKGVTAESNVIYITVLLSPLSSPFFAVTVVAVVVCAAAGAVYWVYRKIKNL